MNERLENLYKKHILEHAKSPCNEYENMEASLVIKAYNPMCGDKFNFYIDVEDSHIKGASFSGFGCSISKASSSVLTKKMIGKDISELLALIENFMKIVSEECPVNPEEISTDEELLAFSGARDFPERKQCASLGWEEVFDTLKDR